MVATIVNGQDCKGTIVCVTGAAGFMASWLVKLVVDKGYIVHATVHDPDNEAKLRHLLDIPGAAERLKLFREELSENDRFNAIIARCQGILHLATLIDYAPKDPENDVTKPARNGTLIVLKACTKATTVKCVVFTSSVAMVSINESAEKNQYIDESYWTGMLFL